MKYHIYKLMTATMVMSLLLLSCEELEETTPVPNTNPSGLLANFQFVNAVPGLASADLLVNNLKTGPSSSFGGVGALTYTTASITTNSIGANTNVKTKASTGTIGGVLGSADLIYRAGNTNINNLQAANGARYTFIAVDSITRPAPLRTLNANTFGDTTFFNRLTGLQISTVERSKLTAAEKQKLVPLGVVPLGSSDPGGPRFVLLTDALTAFASGNVTQSAIRFVNGIPNAINPNARGMTIPANMVTGLTARLVPVSGTTVSIGTNVNYIMAFSGQAPGGFSPTVGSRSTTLSFTLQTTAVASTPINYTLEIISTLGSSGTTGPLVASLPDVTFEVGKSYTVVATGILGKSGDQSPRISIIRHDNP